MARYFQQNEYERPVTDDFEPEEDVVGIPEEESGDQPFPEEIDLDDEEFLTDEERAALRRNRWRVLANLGDFIGVIAGTAVILVLIALIISLVNWVQSDISQSFTLWQTRL